MELIQGWSMKIGIVAPLYESCPPKLYGGTERFVTCLCNGLVDLGHDVTLFASGDSQTKANLHKVTTQSLRLAEPRVYNPHPYITKQISMVMDQVHNFDIIHNNIGFCAFPYIDLCSTPWLTTTHGRLDLTDQKVVFEHFSHTPLVSISYEQRTPLPNNNWIANVYHGLDIQSFTPKYSSGDYFAFLGRVSPEKGLVRAIEIANAVGIPLKIAAKVDVHDKEYYEAEIKSLIDGRHIEYIGEISEEEKSEFLGNALALLFPINWPEPFGLVVIESYACGTPVIARPFGSVPEIIEDGKTGFVRTETADLIAVVDQVENLDRRYIRKFAEENFCLDLMARNYVKVYEQMLVDSKKIAAVS